MVYMEITFQTSTLHKICENSKFANRRLGPDNATKLQRRLDDILAAENVTDIMAGRPHPLQGDLEGHLSISLAGGARLIIKPNHHPVPSKSDGSVDWTAVTAVTVCFIGDYHD